MDQTAIDSNRVGQGVTALTARSREARPVVMRWAVATVALVDIVRAQKDITLSWPEVGVVAARWLEDFGRSTGQWKSHTEAALRMSRMSVAGSMSLDSELPSGWFGSVDRWISANVERYGFFLLRLSLGFVFIWFGILKPFGLGPADELVTKTLPWISPKFIIPFLGVWEIAIGIGLVVRPLLRMALLLLFVHLPGTALPLFVLRDACFTHFPYALTLEGKVVVENLMLVSAAIVVGGTVRHRRSRAEQGRLAWLV